MQILGYSLYLETLYIKDELGKEITSLETLLRALDSYEEEAFFIDSEIYVPYYLLHSFVYMSPDIHGMVDWENGTCDFQGEEWSLLLENVKRYSWDARKSGYDAIACSVTGGSFQSIAMWDTQARNQGMIYMGFPVGDTMLPRVSVRSMCMNAASEHKEGVWEFMKFLLNQQSQQKLAEGEFPVLKSEFQRLCQKELEHPAIISDNNGETIYVSEEQVAQMSSLLEAAKAKPVRTEYIMDIILDETEDYFSGEKTIEQVSAIVENRVQLYLEENR